MYLEKMESGRRIQIQQPGDAINEGFMCKIEVFIDETNEVLIHAPVSRGRLVDLPKFVSYALQVHADNAIYRFRAKVVEYLKLDGFDMVKFKVLDEGEKTQRRDAFRFDCAIAVEFSIIHDNGEQSETEHGLIIDISAGGIKMFSDIDMDEGALLNVQLQLGKEFIVAFGDVRTKMRIPKTKKSRYLFQYGVRFSMMPEGDKERIIRFIYQEQRDQLKKAHRI